MADPITRDDEDIITYAGNKDTVKKLAETIRSRRGIVPFIGAGLTVPYEYQGWTDFLKNLAQEADKEGEVSTLIDNHDSNSCGYERAAEILQQALGFRRFEDLVYDAFCPNKARHPGNITAVEYLPPLFHGPMVTTNFDHVIEDTYKVSGNPFDLLAWGNRSMIFKRALFERFHILLKIHGDVLDESDRVLTVAEYDRQYNSRENHDPNAPNTLYQLLRHLFSGNSVLFIGCSLSNDRVVKVLTETCSDPHCHFAVVERPAEDEAARNRSRFLSDHNIRPIWHPPGMYDQIAVLLDYLIRETAEPGNPVRAFLDADSAEDYSGLVTTLESMKKRGSRYPFDLDRRLGEAHEACGSDLLFDKLDFKKAVEEFRRAKELLPESPEAHYGLGLALLGEGNIKEADSEMARAAELGADASPVLIARAIISYISLDYRKAVSLASDAITSHEYSTPPPVIGEAVPYEIRGLSRIAQQQYDAALDDARIAVGYNPESILADAIPILEDTGFKGGLKKFALTAMVGFGSLITERLIRNGELSDFLPVANRQ
ncbi:SIR2 family protein [Streptosporangium carneum]|uniref:SIR2-like domain-containing protein n=1 Tax=Streptosporangium carneum TaxID=47481 RepID=A0A9W6I1R0_9ACTN|nr:SIR2 family protein [Streptosporangium carneum]GLK09608.1 hypothetical protein GCM10017600_30140 [Streptosporangium carneum]